MPTDSLKIEKTKILVVEGKDEERFFSTLLGTLSLTNIQLMPIGGKSKLAEKLKALRSSPSFDQVVSLGIVRDADTNPPGSFQSVCGALTRAELPVPPSAGVLQGANPATGVLILPDATNPGMLEDLCLASISTYPVMRCIHEYLNCVKSNAHALPSAIAKARVQSFLAVQPEPGKRLGEAAEAGYWPFTQPEFDPIKTFLRLL